METCSNSLCNNTATVEKSIEACFSMTSTATESRMTVKICDACAKQEDRLRVPGCRKPLK